MLDKTNVIIGRWELPKPIISHFMTLNGSWTLRLKTGINPKRNPL